MWQFTRQAQAHWIYAPTVCEIVIYRNALNFHFFIKSHFKRREEKYYVEIHCDFLVINCCRSPTIANANSNWQLKRQTGDLMWHQIALQLYRAQESVCSSSRFRLLGENKAIENMKSLIARRGYRLHAYTFVIIFLFCSAGLQVNEPPTNSQMNRQCVESMLNEWYDEGGVGVEVDVNCGCMYRTTDAIFSIEIVVNLIFETILILSPGFVLRFIRNYNFR